VGYFLHYSKALEFCIIHKLGIIGYTFVI